MERQYLARHDRAIPAGMRWTQAFRMGVSATNVAHTRLLGFSLVNNIIFTDNASLDGRLGVAYF